MAKISNWIIWIVLIALIYFSFTYLSNIIMYLTLGIILAFIGRPFVTFLSEKGVGRIKLSRTFSTFICLIMIGLLFFALSLLFVPLISKQISFFTQLDYDTLISDIQKNTFPLISNLESMNLWPKPEDWESITKNILGLISAQKIGSYFGSAISISSRILITLFAMFFISFFLLKDADLLGEILFSLIPDKHLDKTKNAISNIKELLSRYFVGLIIQVCIISIMVWGGLAIVGVENALVLGIIAGLLNLIPYIGPMLSIVLGVLLGLTSELSLASDINLGVFVLKILTVYAIAIVFDNIITQPIIFSKSVKAHPLEIFLIILIAGTLFGIIGMITAIPAYTVLRVIAIEFFPDLKIVKKMINSMNK